MGEPIGQIIWETAMRKKETKAQRKERLARLERIRTEKWQINLLNHLFYHREAVQQYSDQQKRAVVVEFTRYGCSTVDIHKASGFSLAFVNDVQREFAHQALAEKVRSNGQV
jgi:hypothetical protein